MQSLTLPNVYLPDLKANELVSTAIQTARDNLQPPSQLETEMNDDQEQHQKQKQQQQQQQNKPSFNLHDDLLLTDTDTDHVVDSDRLDELQLLEKQLHDEIDHQFEYFDELDQNSDSLMSTNNKANLPRDLSVRNNYASSKFFNIDNGTIPEEEEEEEQYEDNEDEEQSINDSESQAKSKQFEQILKPIRKQVIIFYSHTLIRHDERGNTCAADSSLIFPRAARCSKRASGRTGACQSACRDERSVKFDFFNYSGILGKTGFSCIDDSSAIE